MTEQHDFSDQIIGLSIERSDQDRKHPGHVRIHFGDIDSPRFAGLEPSRFQLRRAKEDPEANKLGAIDGFNKWFRNPHNAKPGVIIRSPPSIPDKADKLRYYLWYVELDKVEKLENRICRSHPENLSPDPRCKGIDRDQKLVLFSLAIDQPTIKEPENRVHMNCSIWALHMIDDLVCKSSRLLRDAPDDLWMLERLIEYLENVKHCPPDARARTR